MSSKRAGLRKRADLGASDSAPGKFGTASARSPKKCGPHQPQPGDFQVTLDMPQLVPILDRELRAIEILLGGELQDLLSNNAKER